MGFFKMLAEALGWTKKECRIIVVGLDNSGKSTLINHMKPKRSATYEVVPTVGFSEEVFEKGSLRFQVFDMSGHGTYRTLWETYYRDIQAVIFVVDSTDKIRMAVARDELEQMLAHRDVKGKRTPILFFANKMDVAGALEPPDITGLLGLQTISDQPWHITASNAISGEGVDAGIAWLAEQLSRKPATPAAGGGSGSSSGSSAAAGAGSSSKRGS